MKLKKDPVTLSFNGETISILRNRHGIPEISAPDLAGLAFGLGFVHANDRQLHTQLIRILLRGKAAELLKGDPELIAVDQYMRTMNFLPDPKEQTAKLEPDVRAQLAAYVEGYNAYLAENKTVFELRLLGCAAESWTVEDCLLVAKVVGFIGLADSQGQMEKLLIQMIQKGIETDKLKALFPYLTEEIDYELIQKVKLSPPLVPGAVKWLSTLPKLNASNNWAVSGDRTVSGAAMLCGDPHLEVNRLPSVWQEIVMRLPDQNLLGVSMPGVPGLLLGRTGHLAWSATYAFMDMLDYRIEKCQNGMYWRKEGWRPFDVREETIQVKNGEPVFLKVYENEHGILEGEPEGYRLVLSWSAKKDTGAGLFNCILNMPEAETVKQGMDLFKKVEAAAFCFALADDQGNIGYQMTGRLFNRPEGSSGLYPHPGWETAFDPDGFADPNLLPAVYNPAEGLVVTANNDLNADAKGRPVPINLPMGAYRAARIRQLLSEKEKLTPNDMKAIHYDLFSLQAERLMQTIRPLLPETENGGTLKNWDCGYTSDSKGAMLFESVYAALYRRVFGDHGLGRETVDFLLNETGVFNDYYANFDRNLLAEESPWLAGKSQKALFEDAIAEGLDITAKPYGETRKIMLSHLLLGGKLPRWLGFDYGPVSLPGNRATVCQGQIFKSAGRTTTFSPSYRFIAEMDQPGIVTNLAGGPSDRRFSPWYVSDMENWLNGVYKALE